MVSLVYAWQQLEHEIERINIVRNLIKQDIKASNLNKRMQAILIFRYLYNSSWGKIAKTLHVSVGQVHKDKWAAFKIIDDLGKMDTFWYILIRFDILRYAEKCDMLYSNNYGWKFFGRYLAAFFDVKLVVLCNAEKSLAR